MALQCATVKAKKAMSLQERQMKIIFYADEQYIYILQNNITLTTKLSS